MLGLFERGLRNHRRIVVLGCCFGGRAFVALRRDRVAGVRSRAEWNFAQQPGEPVIVIAERCGIDLASSFAATMDEIEAALAAQP